MYIQAPGESTAHWIWTFNYINGNLDSITDPTGRTTDVTIDENHQLSTVTYPDGSHETFFYDSRALLTQHVDRDGASTSYTYDTYGRIQTDTRPIRAVYDPDTGQTNALSEARTFTPSNTAYPLLNESVVGDPDNPAPAVLTSTVLVDQISFGRGGLSGHTNEWGSWTDVSDATGRFTQYERDEANNVLQQSYPSGDCDRFTYDEFGKPLTASRMSAADCARETPLNAQTVTMTYESRFNQIKTITDPDGSVTTYFYDYEVDPNDGVLTDDHLLLRIEYEPVVNALGQIVTPTTEYTYSSWGLVETETDAVGKVTRYVYTQDDDTALFLSGVTPLPGLLTQVIEGDGAANPLVTTYQDFNAQGNAETVIHPGGENIIHYAYDEMGRVISETNAVGATTLYAYDEQGNLVRQVDDYTPDGVTGFNIVTTYAYNAENQLVHQERTAAGLVSFTDYGMDINGNQARQQDELGHGATYRYDDADRLVNTTDAAGNIITYTHDVNGRVETVTNPDGTVNRTEHDGFDRVARSITNWVDGVYDPARPDEDIVTAYQYDGRNNTIIVTDTVGRMTRTFYDDLNRVAGTIANWTPGTTLADCATLPAARDHDICTQHLYDELGRTLVVTDTLGRMTRTFYDDLGRVEASVTNWNPATLASPADCVLSPTNESEENVCTLYGYDDAGRQITTTNALDQTSLTVYDAAGRPTVTVQNWDGAPINSAADCHFPPLQLDVNVCSVTVYDALGRRIQTQDALGHVTDFAYDGLGRVVTTTRYLADGTPVNSVSHYDARGQRYAQTDALGHTTNTVYDELGRAVTTISAEGIATSQTYNEAGQVVASTNALGQATTSAYDDLGRIITSTNPLGQATVYRYDGLGNQVGQVDAEGVETRYEYDGLNRRTAVIENWDGVAACQPGSATPATNVCTQYTYDALGNQVAVVNARGITTSYTIYDELNRAVVVEDALGKQTQTQYNALGYRTVVTDANGAVTRYEYDGLNRLTGEIYETDGASVTYAYDALGNRTTMTDSLGVTTYAHDNLSRLITATSPLTGAVVYGYDLAGNRTHLTYLDGKVVTTTYNADNQTLTVSDWESGITTYTYDATGRLATTTLPNGVRTGNQYDAAGRLTRLRHVDTNTGVLQADYRYQLDGLGNRRLVTETTRLPDGSGPQTQNIAYEYDLLYRVTAVNYSGVLSGTYAYQYDAAGNRVYHSNNVTTTESISYTYDAANRLVESEDLTSGEMTTYAWDDAGRLITTTVGSTVTRVYSYSQDGDLLQAVVDGVTTTFAYDGNGRRLQLTAGGEVTTYLPDYAGAGQRVLWERGPAETKHYLYGRACLGEQATDNATAGRTWRYYQRDGEGLVRQTTNQTATITLAWTFSPDGGVVLGEEGPVTHLGCEDDAVYDWSTGLIFKNGRYFDPELGIWLLGPLMVVFGLWRPRRRGKGRKGKHRNHFFTLLIVLLVMVMPLTGCDPPEPEIPPTETCTPTPVPGQPSPTPVSSSIPSSTVLFAYTSSSQGTRVHKGTAIDRDAILTSNHWLSSNFPFNTIESWQVRKTNNEVMFGGPASDLAATGYLGNDDLLDGGLGLIVFRHEESLESTATLGDSSTLQSGDKVYQATFESSKKVYQVEVQDRGPIKNPRGMNYQALKVFPDHTVPGESGATDSGMGLFSDSTGSKIYGVNNSGEGIYGPVIPQDVQDALNQLRQQLLA